MKNRLLILISIFLVVSLACVLSACDLVFNKPQEETIVDELSPNNQNADDNTDNSQSNDNQQQDIYYEIVFKDYNGAVLDTIQVKEGITPEYTKATPTRASDDRYSYTFNKWEPEIVAASNDAEYTAVYISTVRKYSITYELNGGINNVNNPNEFTFEMNNILLMAPTRNNYTFDGWYFNNVKIDEINTQTASNILLEAHWTYYTLTTETNNSSAGSVTEYNQTKITAGVSTTVVAQTNAGYTFDGWYKSGSRVEINETYTFNMPKESIILEARWNVNSYTITLVNNLASNGVTISGISSGDFCEYGASITLMASGTSDAIKWKRSDGASSYDYSYSFNMPATNLTITLSGICYERNGNEIYYGSYPQSEVMSDPLKNTLNGLAGTLPTSSNSQAWTDYGYYIEGNVASYMWYQDVEYLGSKFRGVYFTSYRPDPSTNPVDEPDYCAQYLSGYYTSNVYWFIWESIKWNILEESNGEALLFADLILDAPDYYPYFSSGSGSAFNHNGGVGYGNNYELSLVRSWLITTFYNTAFNSEEQAILLTKTQDNSETAYISESNMMYNPVTMGNVYPYLCNDTNDQVFLLSAYEIATYYPNQSDRQTQASKYSSCQGASGYGYWLRTACQGNDSWADFINNSMGNIDDLFVSVIAIGVRPACWIEL